MNHVLTAALSVRGIAASQAQQTQRTLTALIALLLVVAAMLALLTIWYWRHTSPRRRARQFARSIDGEAYAPNYELDLDAGARQGDHLYDLDGSYSDAGQRNY